MDVSIYKGVDLAASIFGMYLIDNEQHAGDFHVLTADMSVASCLDRIKLLMPERYTDVGIAEQNMVGVAAGMASEGYHPIAICQATFITMRAFEMDRQLLGYMQNPVILVGLHAGFFLQFMGNTHYAIEDMAIMRTIPGMTVLSPADAGEAVACMEAALKHNGPVYIRLTGGSMAQTVYSDNCEVIIGKNKTLIEGNDIAVFATGTMVGKAMDAAEILNYKGVKARVIDVSSIKPLDTESIDLAKETKLLVSIEEHSVIGGLGAAISEHIASKGGFPPLLSLGVKDRFGKVGDYNFQLEQNRLTSELIVDDITVRINGL